MRLSPSNQAVLSAALLALAVYFTALVSLSLHRYLQFRRVRGTGLVTWPRRRPWYHGLLLALGVLSAFVAVLNATLERPPHHVYSQGIMALYFLAMVPLLARIRLGFYRDGVWAENGFLPWRRIGRMSFREGQEIVLLMLRRGRHSRLFRLPVPPNEYGAVRRILHEKIRDRAVDVEAPILGLGESPPGASL